MKLKNLLPTGLASVFLACAANAQQLYGPWMHDAQYLLSFYVSPNGSDSNSGLSPAPVDAFLTINHAVQQADFFLSLMWPLVPAGVTINVLPGNYTLPASVKLPAFGLSVEAYGDGSGGTATILGNFGNGEALFDFDHLVGSATEAAVGLPNDMPPSIVRGLSFTGNTNGPAIEIDPSASNPGARISRMIEVQVNQCTMSQCFRGILIHNEDELYSEYRNVIVDNLIGSCSVGIEVRNKWWDSDLFRSNRLIGSTFEEMRFNGSEGEAGMLHPRILSNTVNNAFGQMCVSLSDCSARIVNNTLANARNLNTNPATIEIFADAGGSSGEAIVIANNILFSPAYTISGTVSFNPPEIRLSGAAPFGGTLVIDSNDFDNSGVLITPAVATPPSNIGIANALFVNTPGDLHLTDSSPSTVNPGNRAFVVPGPTATIALNGQSVAANCALDVDLDARTHMAFATLAEVLHRGSDEHIEKAVRLRTATTGSDPLNLADRFGNVRVHADGTAKVDLLLDVPAGSVYVLVLGAALPMGPELQHVVVSPFGSLAVDPSPGNGVIFSGVTTTVEPQPFTFSLGQIYPSFLEAEMYLQALVFMPNGVVTFTNRIRLDADGV